MQNLLLAVVVALLLPYCEECLSANGGSSVREASFVTGAPFAKAWGGVYVAYDSISDGSVIYVGFYDDERWLSIAAIDPSKRSLKIVRTAVRFEGWDSHNSVSLGLDARGLLHVAGNVHAQPLRYLVMDRPNDIQSLRLVDHMDGRNEGSVTYPRFLRSKDGRFVFFYRDGGSGNGATRVKSFQDGVWVTEKNPLLARGGYPVSVNAYPTVTVGPEGCFHMAWTWRLSRDANTNFNVSYAKSCDFDSWVDAFGRRLPQPISPLSEGALVERIRPGSGLFNDIRIGFLKDGSPILSYVRRDGAKATQLFHSLFRDNAWSTVQGTDWSYSWDFSGEGTKVQVIAYSGVRQNGDFDLIESVRHPDIGSVEMVFDALSLRFKRLERASSVVGACAGLRDVAATEAGARQFVRPVRLMDGSSSGFFVAWNAFPPDNSDRSPNCAGERGALRCSYQSPIGVCYGNAK